MAEPLYDDLPDPVFFASTSNVAIKEIPTFAIIAWLESKAAEVQVTQDYSQATKYLEAALVLSHTESAGWYESAAVRIASALAVAKARKRKLADFADPQPSR